MEQKLSNRLSALATDAERCADHYIEKPGYCGPATIIDLYRTIALLARELASALQEKDL